MEKIIKIFVIGFFFLFISCNKTTSINKIEDIQLRTYWVDSIFKQMSLEEKVGQLFMVAAYSNRDKAHSDTIKSLIRKHHLGGLIFFQGGPMRQATLTNEYQALSTVPLMIGIDAEWGLKMRLDSTFRYPYNMTLGAIQNNDYVKELGRIVGKHCKKMGIHLNMAPVIDVNTNPNNPIIGVRSFGENKFNVTKKALAFVDGMRSEGILASAKHFPGHGDTDTDSHHTLPIVAHSAERIDSIELYPFKALIKNEVASIMVAHLNVPALEKSDGVPSSLSKSIVTDLLKDKLNFDGLVLTDALNMKGAANFKEPGEIDLVAFEAGNDMLLFSVDSPKGISKIIEAYQNNSITEERLEKSVKKILEKKYDAGLNNYQPVNLNNLLVDLNSEEDLILHKIVVENAITTVKNENHLIPLQKNKSYGYLSLGDGTGTEFLTKLQSGIPIEKVTKNDLSNPLNFDAIIIGYHRKNYRLTYSLNAEEIALINRLSNNYNVILDVFASQYSLGKLNFSEIQAVVISYENGTVNQHASAAMLLGEKSSLGKLPASIGTSFSVGYGIDIISSDDN